MSNDYNPQMQIESEDKRLDLNDITPPVTQDETLNASGMLAAQQQFFDSLDPKAKEYFMEESLKANREALRQEIIENGKVELTDEDKTMYKAPKESCNKCHGEGREGWVSKTGEVIICDCMRRGKLMDARPDEFISYSRFMEIYSVAKPTYPRQRVPRRERNA